MRLLVSEFEELAQMVYGKQISYLQKHKPAIPSGSLNELNKSSSSVIRLELNKTLMRVREQHLKHGVCEERFQHPPLTCSV